MNTILTQQTIDIVKSKSNKEQAEFLFEVKKLLLSIKTL